MVFTVGKIPRTQIGPAGADVLVGRVDERLQRDAQRLVAGHVALPKQLLERIARVLAARALGDVVASPRSGRR